MHDVLEPVSRILSGDLQSVAHGNECVQLDGLLAADKEEEGEADRLVRLGDCMHASVQYRGRLLRVHMYT